MPYITSEEKELLEAGCPIETAGQLNYLFTQLILKYWQNKEQRYQTINDILGAMEGAKLEFVRRIVNSYENEKIVRNGDVYKETVK